MRSVGGRTKKLLAAFHFQFANQAGWECGSCRKNGLEERRRCGWLAHSGEPRVVWARKPIALSTCPRSYISAQSAAWLEEWLVRRALGIRDVRELPARDVEAFLILESEAAAESGNAPNIAGTAVSGIR